MKDRSASAQALRYTTIAFGLVIVGAVLFALGRTLGPSADLRAESAAARFDLMSLVPGEPVLFEHGETLVWILRLTDQQVLTARATDLADLQDALARNAMLPPDTPASFENRTIDLEGAIVMMTARCDRQGLVAVYSDFPDHTWFCMRGAEEYDALGRRLLTNGLGTDSFDIPPHIVSDDGHLILLSAADLLMHNGADHLLYGSND